MLKRVLYRHHTKVVALIIVQRAPIHRHRAVLAVDHVRRLHPRAVQRRRIRHQLEGRPRLIHVAHRQVLQHTRIHVTLIVRIEPRRNRQRKNVPGMRILHDHRPVQRLGLLHLRVQRPLRHVLNVCVNRQHQVFARLRLLLL